MLTAVAAAAAAAATAVAAWLVRRTTQDTKTTTTQDTKTNDTKPNDNNNKNEFLGIQDIMFVTYNSAGGIALHHMHLRLISSAEKSVFAPIVQHYDQIQNILQHPSPDKTGARQDIVDAYNHSLKIGRLVRHLGEMVVTADGGSRVRSAQVLENGSLLTDSVSADISAIRAHTEQLTRVH